MKMRKNILVWICFMLPIVWIQAQKQVSGKVTDSNGDPLAGVNIVVQGTTNGVSADFDGNYSIKANEGDVLLFSYVGFKNTSIVVQNTATYNMVMEEDSRQLNEIVLTSRKKAEYAKDIPISITAIGGVELQKSGSFEFTDYASKIPNLSFGKQGGGGDLADGRTSNSISIRGITGNATTAFYLDEIPLPETIDPKLIDIKQVEVLRGPQGTLYGSSALGGALRVLTNEPNTKGFYANIGTELSSVKEGGLNYGTDVVVNVPLKKSKSALRLVGFYNFRSGIFDKVPSTLNGNTLTALNNNHPALTQTIEDVDDEATYGFHAGLKLTPINGLTILPKIIFQRTESDGYNLADIRPGNFTAFRSADIDEDFEDRFTSYSLTMKYDTGKGEFVSASSYFDRFYSETEDITEFFTFVFSDVIPILSPSESYPVSITRDGDFNKFIQELRYVSDLDSKFNFSGGLFYATETLDEFSLSASSGLGDFLNPVLGPFPEPTSQFDDIYRLENENKIREISVFAEIYYDITDRLQGTIGARYFNAKSERDRTVSPSFVSNYELLSGELPTIENDGINPKFGLKYKLDDDNLLYVSASKGFRIGGVNPILPSFSFDEATALFGTTDTPQTFESDFLWSYELGAKLGFAQRRVTLNTAIFYNDWSDLQLRSLLPESGYNFITNVDSARSMGFELDVTAYLIEGLAVGGSLGLIDTEITDLGENARFSQAEEGAEILLVPDVTASGNAEYSWDAFGGTMFIRGDIQYSGQRFSNFDKSPERTLDAYTIVNSRVGLQLKKYDISLFINNLTNENANFGDVISLGAEVPGRVRYAQSRPITFGTSLRLRF